MKEILILLVLSLLVSTFGCEPKNTTPTNPTPDTLQVDLYDNDSLCLSKDPNRGTNEYYSRIEPFAVSTDYSLCLIATAIEDSMRLCINTKTNSLTVLDKKFWDTKRNGWVRFDVSSMYLSCPYDSKKFFGALYTGNPDASAEKVKEYAFWGIFEPETGNYNEIVVKTGSDTLPVIPQNIRILRWMPNSSPNNDYFFLSNNTILHLQSGTVTEGVTSFMYLPSMKIESVSPNGKLLVYEQNRKKYINGKELPALPFGIERRIHWSNDSKHITYTSMGSSNSGRILVEILSVDDVGNSNLVHTINLTKRFCSYGVNLHSMFLSNNSIGTCVFKYDQVAGNFFEISFDGKLIKEWTNFWRPQ